jgi:ribose transport system substrate-binding protein
MTTASATTRRYHPLQPAGRRHLVRGTAPVAGLVALCICLAACSSSGSSSGSTSAAGAGGVSSGAAGSGAGGSSFVAEAKAAVSAATQGLVFSPTDTPANPSDLTAYGSWRGPTAAPPPRKNALVEIIPCTMQAPACATTAEATAAAAKALGWRTDIITSGAVNPEQAAQAFNVALSRKPQAIVAVAVDAALAPHQIAAAEKAGIVTVEDADDPVPSEQVAYDAYVSYRQPLEWALDAYAIVADSNGTANVLGVDITDNIGLHAAYSEFKAVMGQCGGCKLTTISMSIAQLSDPTQTQQQISAAIAAHPSAGYLQMTASYGLPPVVAAIRQAGKQDKLKVLVEDADPSGLNALTQGEAVDDPGFSLGWLAYAGIDQVVRGLAKAPFLTKAQIGLGLHMFTPATTPASGNTDDYAGYKTYAAQYDKIWGVNG